LEKVLWAPRVAQGIEALFKHSKEGFTGAAGIMPARGGNPGLTDQQLEATVKWMLENLK
jgi:cytochrome c5